MTTTRARAKTLMIAGMAVSATLFTSACSRGNSGGSPAGTPIQAQPGVPGKPTTQVRRADADRFSGRSPGPTAQQPGKSVTGSPAPEGIPGAPKSGAEAETQSTVIQPLLPTLAPAAPGQVVLYDPSGVEPERIFLSSANQGTAMGGAVSDVIGQDGQPMVFSGGGQDSLHEQLASMLRRDPKSELEKAADAELARRLANAQVTVDWSSRTARLELLVHRQKGPLKISVSEKLANDLTFSAGRLDQAPHVAIDAACMDLNGGCSTVHIRVREGSHGGPVKTAHMIARRTDASLYFKGKGFGLARNAEYDRLLAVLVNTVERPYTLGVVNELKLLTSETIGGSSSFTLAMHLRAPESQTGALVEQVLSWSGPLVKPAANDHMNLTVRQLPTLVGANCSVIQPISDSIRETRLVRNDGRGNLQFEMTIRKATAQASEDQLLLTIARIHKPVRALVLQ